MAQAYLSTQFTLWALKIDIFSFSFFILAETENAL